MKKFFEVSMLVLLVFIAIVSVAALIAGWISPLESLSRLETWISFAAFILAALIYILFYENSGWYIVVMAIGIPVIPYLLIRLLARYGERYYYLVHLSWQNYSEYYLGYLAPLFGGCTVLLAIMVYTSCNYSKPS